MSHPVEVTSGNFQTMVGAGVALIDFWAEWCGPCRMMHPIIDELAAEFSGKATIGKINVDNEGELAEKFGVQSIPTLVILKNGVEQKRFVGVTQKTKLAEALNSVL
ncbi:MAG TPA: thioredoxin [Candidatus Hydrogenedentes bacterium]|nr:thioredoxin [Candidatus Hydrogenedentota bacterium]HOL77903.1 thioredoxin [Candidatus Hydrogenedentota bacterium]HPO87127.1 thioredoxin [Candidatus Hydrogenedentota bacterium]